jgi:NitT/TauT family transport system permease protein
MRLINVKPGRGGAIALAALPFAGLAVAYLVGSALRLQANPADKLLPALSTMADTISAMAFTRCCGCAIAWPIRWACPRHNTACGI